MNGQGCLACDILAGRKEEPGGILYQTKLWAVDHCVGPLPLGTLILKPVRHVLTVAELTEDEVEEYGQLLFKFNRIVKQITNADQIYNCQWSHVDYATGEAFKPGHIHFVLQPAWNHQREQHKKPGPFLQVDMFTKDEKPAKEAIERVAEEVLKLLNQ